MKTKQRPYAHFKFPDEIFMEYSKMTESECNWFNVFAGSYKIRCTNYGWFPQQILMGTVDRRFADTNNIGATISGNLGTSSIAVVDLNKAIELLNDAGYTNINELINQFSLNQ